MENKSVWTYDELTYSHMKMFRILALIPFRYASLSGFRTRFLSLLFHSTLLMSNVTFMGYGIKMVKRKTIEVDYVCEHVSIIYTHFRYVILFLKREKFRKLLEMCKNIWLLITPEESRIVRNYERKAYYFGVFLLANTLATITLFIIPSYIMTIYFPSGNVTVYKPPLKLVSATGTFWEINDELRYKMTVALQTWGTIVGTMTVAGTETIANFLVLIPCGYLKLLKQRFLAMSKMEKNILKIDENCNVNKSIATDLKMNIHLHQKIMLYCEELERFMRSFYFVSIFFTVYNIAILGMTMLENNSDTMKYVPLFIMNLFQFFTCQCGPQYLIIESSAIAKATYFVSFGNFHEQEQIDKALNLMIIRAQKPAQMTAGGYVKLSIETFGTMVRSAYSFFALLRNFNQRSEYI